jgi:hypothetical protein
VQRLVGCKVHHSGGVRHSVTGYVIDILLSSRSFSVKMRHVCLFSNIKIFSYTNGTKPRKSLSILGI